MRRRLLVFTIVALVGVAAVVVILHVVGVERTALALGEAGPLAMVAMIVVSLSWLGCQALAWDRLSRPVGHYVPFRTLYGAVLIGFAGNYLTPSMYVGGEPLRVAYLGRRRRLPYYQVAGTVLLGKYLEFIAFVLLVSIGTGVALVYYWDDLADLVRVLMSAGALLLVGILVLLMVVLFGRHHPVSRAVEWLIEHRFLRRTLRRRRRRIRQMEEQIAETFNREGRSTFSAFAALALGISASFVRPLVFFYFLKARTIFTFPELCLIFALTQFVLAMQITPGSLGTYEGGMIGIFAILGRSDHLALAYAICMRLAEGLIVLLGCLFAMHQGVKILAQPERESAEADGAKADAPSAAAPMPQPDPSAPPETGAAPAPPGTPAPAEHPDAPDDP